MAGKEVVLAILGDGTKILLGDVAPAGAVVYHRSGRDGDAIVFVDAAGALIAARRRVYDGPSSSWIACSSEQVEEGAAYAARGHRAPGEADWMEWRRRHHAAVAIARALSGPCQSL